MSVLRCKQEGSCSAARPPVLTLTSSLNRLPNTLACRRPHHAADWWVPTGAALEWTSVLFCAHCSAGWLLRGAVAVPSAAHCSAGWPFQVAVPSARPAHTLPPHPRTPAGIQTATDAFSAADLLYINSLFSLQTVVRQVGGSPPYYCTASECQAAKPCWVLGAVDGGQRGGRRAGAVQCPRSAGGKCHAGKAISAGRAAAVPHCAPSVPPVLDSAVAGNKQPLSSAGCLPQDYSPVYGRAIEGPVYAGIGPPTVLTRLSSASEPDEAGRGYTIEITATLVVSNLREGARYKVGWLTGRLRRQAGHGQGGRTGWPCMAA